MSSAETHPALQPTVGISVRPPPGSPTAAATEHLLALKGALVFEAFSSFSLGVLYLI